MGQKYITCHMLCYLMRNALTATAVRYGGVEIPWLANWQCCPHIAWNILFGHQHEAYSNWNMLNCARTACTRSTNRQQCPLEQPTTFHKYMAVETHYSEDIGCNKSIPDSRVYSDLIWVILERSGQTPFGFCHFLACFIEKPRSILSAPF